MAVGLGGSGLSGGQGERNDFRIALPAQGEARTRANRGRDFGHVSNRDRVRIELDYISVAPQVEERQQTLPGAAARARPGIHRGNVTDLGISQLVRKHNAVAGRQAAVVEDHEAPTTQPCVERFGRHQIPQQHVGADHREQHHAILAGDGRRRIKHGARQTCMARFAQFAQRPVGKLEHRALPLALRR